MNEAQTRFNKIDPKLRDAGWGIVPGSKILVEQSAYIAPGRITTTGNKNPKKADYILEYKGQKLAVIEAKSDEKDGEDSRIIEYAKKEENEQLRPYTMQEIDEMLDEAEAAFEAGEYLTNDEVFHHKENGLKRTDHVKNS